MLSEDEQERQREELHERLVILKEELEAGRVQIAPGLRVVQDLQKVRYGDDGKVDPATVEGTVRALALGVAHARSQRELRGVPLREVQAAYFDLVDRFFHHPLAEMKKHGVTPHDIAEGMAATDSLVRAFLGDFDELAAGIMDFWRTYGPVVDAHLTASDSVKSVFGGDLSPSYVGNVASSAGLYVDTIVLPDPLLRLVSWFGLTMKPDRLVYYVSKHALNMLGYREFALADTDPPIVVVSPEQSSLDESVREHLARAGEIDLIAHCAHLFGQEFDSTEELSSYVKQISTADELVGRLAEPERLLFDTDWHDSVHKQLERYAKEALGILSIELPSGSVGEVVYRHLVSRMMQVEDILLYSSNFGGSPLVDAPTSWQYLVWKYGYDKDRFHTLAPDLPVSVITRALHVAGAEELPMIGRLPAKALVELRQKGALNERREVIRQGMSDVSEADPIDFDGAVQQVVGNLEAALTKHNDELLELGTSGKRFFGVDVLPAIVAGGLSIAAVSTGNLALSLAGTSVGIAGVSSVRELFSRGRKLVERRNELRRSPMGILLRYQ